METKRNVWRLAEVIDHTEQAQAQIIDKYGKIAKDTKAFGQSVGALEALTSTLPGGNIIHPHTELLAKIQPWVETEHGWQCVICDAELPIVSMDSDPELFDNGHQPKCGWVEAQHSADQLNNRPEDING